MNKFIFTLSNEEMTKINIIDLEKLYNFIVQNFSKFGLKICLPSVFLHSAKKVFAKCQKKLLGKAGSLPSVKKKHSAKTFFAKYFF